MMEQELPREDGMSEEERRHRERVYHKATLAQSIPPRGLAQVLNATPEDRARVRERWRALSRRQRLAIATLYAWGAAWTVVLGIGLFSESDRLIIAWGLAVGVTMLVLTAVLVVGSLRERR